MLEKFFENAMWKTRLFVLLPVIFGLIGAVILFVVGSVDIFEVLVYTLEIYLNGLHPDVVILRDGYGVFIIEVKDWELDYYRYEDYDEAVLESTEIKEIE